ncbi:MAG TPA: hypothetical protein VK619_10475 [Pyrinomonadaceae bacterium]|nr:hypothetical protein [Pyrinomonadaceae bacterium]
MGKGTKEGTEARTRMTRGAEGGAEVKMRIIRDEGAGEGITTTIITITEGKTIAGADMNRGTKIRTIAAAKYQ